MRSHPARLVALAFGLALVASACGGSSGTSTAAGAPAATEEQAPSFTAAQLTGGELDSATYAGKDVVLWFWAPWCTSCRAEAPNVVASAAALDGKVEVIGVAGRGEVPEMEGFVSDTGTGGLNHVVDDDGSIWTSYGVASQPSFAFVNDDGTVDVHIGAMGEEALTERMNALAAA